MAFTTIIYHNPKCGTSRRVLETLKAHRRDPQIVNYLEKGWSAALLKRLIKASGATPRDFLRTKEPLAAELGLTAADAKQASIVAAMVTHPVLVERPIVETEKGVRLCRPAERVLDIL